jgi:hypothetical protein
MTLERFRLDDPYYHRQSETPRRDAKIVATSIGRCVFIETQLAAYRLKTAAYYCVPLALP